MILNLISYISILQLQKSTKEIKLCYLTKGDFLQILESKKIEIFLEWLLKNNLLIHFYVMDVIYWSVVDIRGWKYQIFNSLSSRFILISGS